MTNPPAVELKDVCLAFQGMTVLDHVNLTLGESEFMGLIGPNGGGKTVLLRVMLGLLKPDSGSVRIFGRPPEQARGLTAYVPQYAHFDRTFPISVIDVVMMGRLHERRLFRAYSAADREHALRALKRVRMDALAHRQIGKLSGGQLQRVLIARALAVEPRILLLDEPTANLDTAITNELYELLDELSGRMAVVLVSHDIGVISSRVKTVGCMNRRLHYHHAREITREMIEESYGCPVDFIVHEHTHRVLESHSHGPGGPPHSH